MAKKPASEKTSGKVASAAAKVMKDPKASKDAKSAVASALTQKTKGSAPAKKAPAKKK